MADELRTELIGAASVTGGHLGAGPGVEMPEVGEALEIGKGRIIREGTKVALLSFGARPQECLSAAEELAARGPPTTVAVTRFYATGETVRLSRFPPTAA